MPQNFFCIFCENRDFFKSDLKQHIISKHKTKREFSKSKQIDEQFNQFIDSLINYCSEVEKTFKLKPKCLPDNNVNELLVGCPLCDQIISFYQLKSFDRNEKLSKNICICGANHVNTSNVELTTIICCLCKHLVHWECAEAEEYSGQDLTSYLCSFCKTRNFSIETCNDMKPLDQLKHFRQHFNYKPFKCIIDVEKCGLKFFSFPLFIDHIKCVHNLSEDVIKNSKNSLYSYEKIVEIEDLLELKGIKSELLAFDFGNDENNTAVKPDIGVKIETNTENMNDVSNGNDNDNQTSNTSTSSVPTTTITIARQHLEKSINKAFEKIKGTEELLTDSCDKNSAIDSLHEIDLTEEAVDDSNSDTTCVANEETNEPSVQDNYNPNQNPIKETINEEFKKITKRNEVVFIDLTTDSSDTDSADEEEKDLSEEEVDDTSDAGIDANEEMDLSEEAVDDTSDAGIDANEETNRTSVEDNYKPNDHQNYKRFCAKLGHISCVYCIAFDRTGKHIFTGSDDYLVKIWCSTSGRLISTLRGHLSEITDICVNFVNTLLASGDISNLIYIWSLQKANLLKILKCHTKQITSLKFCPLSQTVNRYLVSTGDDGRVCFWKYNSITSYFESEPNPVYIDQHKKGSGISCSSFSSGGHLLAIGSTDSYVGIYSICTKNGPKKIFQEKQHWGHVDRIHFSHNSLRFVSSSNNVSNEANINKDNAFIWYFDKSMWNVIPIKCYKQKSGDNSYGTLIVEMAWNRNDEYIITSLTDHSIKIWRSSDGELMHVLTEHNDEVHCIQTHPIDENIFMSASYDFKVIIWDIRTGSAVKKFKNQRGRAILDSSFSPNGLIFATTDCYGQLSLFGCGPPEPYKHIPKQLFFHTDYHPLLSIDDSMVIDAETKTPTHLLPIPFLVNIKGVPYPQKQHLVPGRENCSDSQNKPYVCVYDTNRFVLEPVIKPETPNSAQSSPVKENGLHSTFKIAQLIDILCKHMTHKDMFNTLFMNYIKLARNISEATVQAFYDLLIKVVTNKIKCEEFVEGLTKLLSTPPKEYYLPVLKYCLPFLRQNCSNSITSNRLVSAENHSQNYVFQHLIRNAMFSSTSGNSLPTNGSNLMPTTVSSNSVNQKSVTNSSINNKNSSAQQSSIATPQQLPANIMQCQTFLSLKLLLASIQPSEVAADVKALVQNLIDDTIEVDEFIEKVKEKLDLQIFSKTYSQFLKDTLPQFRIAINNNEIQIEGITAPPLFPPNNLLFKPRKMVNSEHNYYDPRHEESVDKRTLFLRDTNADKGPANEKGWKVANLQLLRRPANWVSHDFETTLDQVWAQRDAVTQLTAYDLQLIIQQLKQKEFNEISIYQKACIKRQLESDESVNDTSIVMNDNLSVDTSAGPSQPSTSRILRSRDLRLSNSSSESKPKRHRSLASDLDNNSEISENPFIELATQTNCLKFPYYPQLGDEVVYSRVGHQEYIDAIMNRKLKAKGLKQYKYSETEHKDLESVYAKVVDIIFETEPNYHIHLKLAEIDPKTNEQTINFFDIHYHRIENISDFIILRQMYEKSIGKKLKIGDYFRTTTSCGNFWTFGVIVDKDPFSDTFPKSKFKLLIVNTRDNQLLRMSPWDLEPVDIPADVSHLPITNHQRLAFYKPQTHDWPECGRRVECNRLEKGFTLIMGLSDALLFTSEGSIFNETDVPKPLYPINLSIITERIKNRFYRRSQQIKFDVNYIFSNVYKYLNSNSFLHENYSEIHVKAKLITEVCLEFIDEPQCDNPINIYNERAVDEKFSKDKFRIQRETEERKYYFENRVKLEKMRIKRANNQNRLDSSESEGNPIHIIQVQDNVIDHSQQDVNQMETDVQNETLLKIGAQNPTETQNGKQPEVETEMKIENQNGIESEMENEMLTEVKNEILGEVENEMQEEVETHMETENQIQPEIGNELLTRIVDDIQRVDCETQTEVNEMLSEVKLEIKPEMKTEVTEEPEREEVNHYFCIFCHENTYFFDKSEAFEHYRQHLKELLQCGVCYARFVDRKGFKSHNTEHSRNDQNLINVQNYYLCIAWINSFLDFQLTEKFKRLARNCREFCPVCHVIKTNSLLLMTAQNFCDSICGDLTEEEPFGEHIRKHLNCEKVFQCLNCENNGSNEHNSSFCFNTTEAHNHLGSHPSLHFNSTNISEITISSEQYFNVSHTLNPKLQTFIDKLTTISDSINELDENYSND